MAALGAVISLVDTPPVQAGEVTGSIAVAANYSPEESDDDEGPRTFGWEEWNGVLPIRPLRFQVQHELSVVLVQSGSSGSPVGCNYALRNGDLSPSTMVVGTGTDLNIVNHDGCVHELYANDVDSFTAGPVQPGSGRSARMPSSPSVFTVRDALYPHVLGHVHVISDLAACAQLDARGTFRFTDVPAGDYTLRVYHRETVITEQEVTVGSGPRPTSVPSISFPAESSN